MEAGSQRFAHKFQAVEGAPIGKNGGRLGPLFTICFEQPTRLQATQQTLKQVGFRRVLHQTRTECAQHRGIQRLTRIGTINGQLPALFSLTIHPAAIRQQHLLQP
jgi:hypothetical protein